MRGGSKGFRPLMWDPNEQRIYVRTDMGIYSGAILDIRFNLTPSDGLSDSAVVFDPSAKISGAVVANAIVHAVRVAEHEMTEGVIR